MSEANTAANFDYPDRAGSTTVYWKDSPQWGAEAATELEPVRSLPRFILLHGTVLEPDELVLRVKYIVSAGSAEGGALVEYQCGNKVEQYRVTETPAQILALITGLLQSILLRDTSNQNGEAIEVDDE